MSAHRTVDRAKLVKLRAKGVATKDIAKILGITSGYVSVIAHQEDCTMGGQRSGKIDKGEAQAFYESGLPIFGIAAALKVTKQAIFYLARQYHWKRGALK